MFNRKSSYALNKKDANAIVYIDANGNIIRLTHEDFASEEEFQKWKSWSDENYHTEDNRDVVEGKLKIFVVCLTYGWRNAWGCIPGKLYFFPNCLIYAVMVLGFNISPSFCVKQ